MSKTEEELEEVEEEEEGELRSIRLGFSSFVQDFRLEEEQKKAFVIVAVGRTHFREKPESLG